MAETRHRQRLIRMDHVKPDGSNWNQIVHLGDFQDKLIEYHNGIPVDVGWGNPYSPVDYVPEFSTKSYENTWDELHPRSRSKSGKVIYKTGGPFLNVKVDTGLPASGVYNPGTYVNVSGTRRYVGGFMPPSSDYWGSGWGSSPALYTTASNALLPDVSAYFDRAWSMAKPKLEYANLYTFLSEIGDVVPMLETSAKAFALQYQTTPLKRIVDTDFGPVEMNIGARISSRSMGPKDLAEHFINHNFGWVPFLGDIGDFAATYVDADAIIRRITAENGKWIRKKVKVSKDDRNEVLVDETAPHSSISYGIPCFPYAFPADFFLSPPSWTVTESEKLSITAAGEFRFYRPEFDSSLPDYSSAWNQVTRAMKIYGAEVNPYHIWQATPWSWLADWVSNLGAHIQRLQDSIEDQVAAAYFFITSHKSVVRTMTIRLPFVTGLVSLSFERSYFSRQRVSADSPYGFRLSWDDLSPKRIAILGAIGITRKGARHG
uniref:Maturation n=1 Tax=Leviviridae sp. TaxID=2027243 RepID=A0A514DD57_9VIRU|nr:MAG: hypothetical protein H2RhizoLitter491068_000001 [Leviviridae sp.]